MKNNHCLIIQVKITTFQHIHFYLLFNVSSVTTLIVKKLLQINFFKNISILQIVLILNISTNIYKYFPNNFTNISILQIILQIIYIGISHLTSKKIRPSKESAIRDHLLICNNVPSFDEFLILAHGNNRFVLEIKESWLIKRDKLVLNKNISSARLFLFDN